MNAAFDGASTTATRWRETPQERLERALFELQRAFQAVVAAPRAVRDARQPGN